MSSGWKTFAALTFSAVAFDARAASFDCAKAVRPQEKLVCSDPGLSRLDEEMAAIYRNSRNLLSETGRRTLLAGQRSWLRYWPRDCSSARGSIVFDAEAVACARTRYKQRIAALKVDTAFDGRFRVHSVAAYSALWTPTGEDRWFLVVGHFWIHPRIDLEGLRDTDLELARKVNAWLTPDRGAVRRKLADDAGTSFTWTRLRVVSRNILGASTEWETYGDGAFHSLEGVADSYFDKRRMRVLVPGDIFQGKEWVGVLGELAFAELRAKLGDELLQGDPRELSPPISDMGRWTMRREGLAIHFGEYEVASYADGMPSVLIPWSKVAPYLTDFARAEFRVTEERLDRPPSRGHQE